MIRNPARRYRERQKSKLQDSEEKVAELAAQLRQLQTEKASAESHSFGI